MVNGLLAYLSDNRERLNLERYGLHGEISFILLTPRFRASSHVVFLIFDKGQSAPALVAKIPRRAGALASLEREATHLRMLQAMRGAGSVSTPALVAFEPFYDRAILLETALTGQPMDPAFVRRKHELCCSAMADWLCELRWPASGVEQRGANLFGRLVEAPYRTFVERFPLTAEEEDLLEKMWGVLERLRDMTLPAVFEHGDVSHPNLFMLDGGRPGIVDWETAEPFGLPACDLFFFLMYVAASRQKARTAAEYLSAFRSAFWVDGAWARQYVSMYAARLQLPERALTPLFMLCWLRYLVSLLTRIEQAGEPAERTSAGTAAWLRANRFYAIWKHSVGHAEELDWGEGHAHTWRVNSAGLLAAE